jgi:hypothetical protein
LTDLPQKCSASALAQMNAIQRSRISSLINRLTQIESEIWEIADGEQDKYDNLNDGLQQTERGQAMEQSSQSLQEAADHVQSAINSLSEMTGEVAQ